MATFTFNVFLNRKKLCSLSQEFPRRQSAAEMADYVRSSLIVHDHYDQAIKVRLSGRTTRTEWVIEEWTGECWAESCTEGSRKACKEQMKCYRENGCQVRSFTRRVSLWEA